MRKPAKTLAANSPSWSTLPDEVKNAPLLIGQFLGDKAALAWGAVSVKYRRAVHRQLDYVAAAQESLHEITEGMLREDAALSDILAGYSDGECAALGLYQ